MTKNYSRYARLVDESYINCAYIRFVSELRAAAPIVARRLISGIEQDKGRQMEPNRVRIIAFQEGDMWVGQCLEYDVGAQAPDLQILHTRLMLALSAERDESMRRHGKPFAGIDPAPRHFHEMWEKQSGSFSPRRSSKLPNNGLPNVDMALCA